MKFKDIYHAYEEVKDWEVNLTTNRKYFFLEKSKYHDHLLNKNQTLTGPVVGAFKKGLVCFLNVFNPKKGLLKILAIHGIEVTRRPKPKYSGFKEIKGTWRTVVDCVKKVSKKEGGWEKIFILKEEEAIEELACGECHKPIAATPLVQFTKSLNKIYRFCRNCNSLVLYPKNL